MRCSRKADLQAECADDKSAEIKQPCQYIALKKKMPRTLGYNSLQHKELGLFFRAKVGCTENQHGSGWQVYIFAVMLIAYHHTIQKYNIFLLQPNCYFYGSTMVQQLALQTWSKKVLLESAGQLGSFCGEFACSHVPDGFLPGVPVSSYIDMKIGSFKLPIGAHVSVNNCSTLHQR